MSSQRWIVRKRLQKVSLLTTKFWKTNWKRPFRRQRISMLYEHSLRKVEKPKICTQVSLRTLAHWLLHSITHSNEKLKLSRLNLRSVSKRKSSYRLIYSLPQNISSISKISVTRQTRPASISKILSPNLKMKYMSSKPDKKNQSLLKPLLNSHYHYLLIELSTLHIKATF